MILGRKLKVRVLDGAVTVLDGKKGVESQTEIVWKQVEKYDVLRIIFDIRWKFFNMCLDSLKKTLGIKAVPIQCPIGSESSFCNLGILLK